MGKPGMATWEGLERRRHFNTTSLSLDGTLSIVGTEDPDQIAVLIDGNSVTVDGQQYTQITRIEIHCSDGGDAVVVVSTEAESTITQIVIDLGSGDDLLDASGSAIPVQVLASGGDNIIIGSSSNDTLVGGDGDDLILGGSGQDEISAGMGANYIAGGGNLDVILQSDDADPLFLITITETYPGFYEVIGTDRDDFISIAVDQTNETFTFGDNTFGGVSSILVHGLGGNDAITASGTTGSITAQLVGGAGNDSLSLSFDGAIWGGEGNDRIRLADSFRGEARGDGGDDMIQIVGYCQEALVTGGDGNDLIDCSNNFYAVLARGGAGNDTIFGSNFGDQLFGDDGHDNIFGLNGSDLIDGGAGADSMYGGNGNDVFYASAGWYVDGGLGTDTVYAWVLDGMAVDVTYVHQRT